MGGQNVMCSHRYVLVFSWRFPAVGFRAFLGAEKVLGLNPVFRLIDVRLTTSAAKRK
jgi:hypothetical protein